MDIAFQRSSGTSVDEIADVLRERIVAGRLVPGTPLSQRHLAADLSFTRAGIGEALRMLCREGLVAAGRPGAGMRVAAADCSALLSAFAVREVLDGLAAKLAAIHAGPGVEKRARAALGEQRTALQSADRPRFMRADVSFHMTLVLGSANPILPGQMGPLRSTVRTATLLGIERLTREVMEHDAVLAAVCHGDAEDAERAAREHVRATVAALRDTGKGPTSDRPAGPLSRPDAQAASSPSKQHSPEVTP
jgi:DNA-binding GntR family transcriptional regulator